MCTPHGGETLFALGARFEFRVERPFQSRQGVADETSAQKFYRALSIGLIATKREGWVKSPIFDKLQELVIADVIKNIININLGLHGYS